MNATDAIHDDLLLELVCDLLAAGREARFFARGNSMHPVIADGSRVVVRPLKAAQLRPGMIALYLPALPDGRRGMVLHRFLGLNSDGMLHMRGDACPLPDPPVPADTVVGQVVEVQRGRWRIRASHPLWAWLLVRGIALPRILAQVLRLRARLKGYVALPFLTIPSGRLLRERALVRMGLGVEESLLDLEEAAEPLRLGAGEEELVPLILTRARKAMIEPIALPPDCEQRDLESRWQLSRTQSALEWLERALAKAGEEVLLTKGAALAWEVYPQPHCRPLADIDGLVRTERREAVTEALLAAGAALADPEYTLSQALDRRHKLALRLPGTGWPVVELHWLGVSSPLYNRRCKVERFWEGCHDSIFGPALQVMSTEAEFVCEVLHLAKHFPQLRLIWAVDLATLAATKPNWDHVAAWLKTDNACLPGAVICHWLEQLAPSALPAGFTERLAAHAVDGVGRFESRVFTQHDRGKHERLQALCQPGLVAVLGALARLCVPSRRQLARAFPHRRDAWLPLLMGLHLLRLVRGQRHAGS